MFTETKTYCEHRNKYDNKIENRTPHLGHAHWKLGFTLGKRLSILYHLTVSIKTPKTIFIKAFSRNYIRECINE